MLDQRRVLQILAEIGVAAAIAGKSIGQQVRMGRNIGLEAGAEFGPGGGRQHRDTGVASDKAVLMLDRVAVLSGLVFRRRHLLDGDDDQSGQGGRLDR